MTELAASQCYLWPNSWFAR